LQKYENFHAAAALQEKKEVMQGWYGSTSIFALCSGMGYEIQGTKHFRAV